jgi:acetolactate synthase-1/2/3 large subunit
MPGMHGMYWNNIAMTKADLLIGIGMRFDDRVTGRLRDFATQAKKIHIDIDPAELEKNVVTAAPIAGDVKKVLGQLLDIVKPARHEEWVSWIEQFRAEHPSIAIPETDKLLPQTVIKAICENVGGDGYIVTGVGQHQMWAAQFYWNTKPGHFVTSGGLGTMGYEVPAAIGAQVGVGDAPVWSICGDGGFQMTSYELATVAENQLPIKYAIIKISRYGAAVQELFYKNNRSQLKNHPDFVKAEAYGILGLRDRQAQVSGAIDYANKHPVGRHRFQVDESECVSQGAAALFERSAASGTASRHQCA